MKKSIYVIIPLDYKSDSRFRLCKNIENILNDFNLENKYYSQADFIEVLSDEEQINKIKQLDIIKNNNIIISKPYENNIWNK